jgi:thiosulfate/3-mercaptopyruvate sulfurtransferase
MDEPVVVSPEWLADRRDEVTVVDVRDAWEYEGIGHVPGAVNVPFDSFRAEEHAAERGEGDGMLPGADRWRSLMEAAGIRADDVLVAYDDTHGVFAARFLVTALAYGHRHLHLLDGDYSAWTRERETSTAVPDREPTSYEVRENPDAPFVNYETVRELIGSEDVVVVDTREPREYEEGHLPGAVQLDWRETVDEESRGLKPRAELSALFADRGVTPDRRVLLYCNTARRISHTYVVLQHLGYGEVLFYEGSLTEWEARGGPVEQS